LRVAVKDVEAARKFAERKGLRYQTYIKMLLHEALQRERERSPAADWRSMRQETVERL
jgi:hypothetical protein